MLGGRDRSGEFSRSHIVGHDLSNACRVVRPPSCVFRYHVPMGGPADLRSTPCCRKPWTEQSPSAPLVSRYEGFRRHDRDQGRNPPSPLGERGLRAFSPRVLAIFFFVFLGASCSAPLCWAPVPSIRRLSETLWELERRAGALCATATLLPPLSAEKITPASVLSSSTRPVSRRPHRHHAWKAW